MNSTLKTALPIVLVVLMVFGVTFMSQFTAPQKAKDDGGPADLPPPLEVPLAERYAGYFEIGTTGRENRVAFMIRNARETPVYLTALTPSCALCTSASAAVIPPEVIRPCVDKTLPGLLTPLLPTNAILSAAAWTQARTQLKWHAFEFSNASNKFELPAAAPHTGPAWAVLELGFDMKDAGAPAPRKAYFDVYDAQGQKLLPQPFTFTVYSGGREVQELTTTEFHVGTLTEGNPAQTFEVQCISALRDDLPPPAVAVGNNDPYVTVGPPQPLSAETLQNLSRAASAPATAGAQPPPPIYYRSGYRIPITVNREAGGKPMDVGAFDKEVFVSGGPGVTLKKPLRAHVQGSVAGIIQLENVTKIDFGSYDSNFAQKKEVRLWTDKPGVELEALPEQTVPTFLKAALGPPTSAAGRTYWPLTVQIPTKEGRQPPWDGIVYLRTKGPTPVTIRVQVSGHGR